MSDNKATPHILQKTHAFDMDYSNKGGVKKNFEFHDPSAVVIAFDPTRSLKRFSVYLLNEEDGTTSEFSRHLMLSEAWYEYERLMELRGDFVVEENQKALKEYENGN